jgi:hypothetical protein
MKSKSNMPSQGSKKSSHSSGTNTGPNTGLTMSSSVRADGLKKPTDKNPYPKGLA